MRLLACRVRLHVSRLIVANRRLAHIADEYEAAAKAYGRAASELRRASRGDVRVKMLRDRMGAADRVGQRATDVLYRWLREMGVVL